MQRSGGEIYCKKQDNKVRGRIKTTDVNTKKKKQVSEHHTQAACKDESSMKFSTSAVMKSIQKNEVAMSCGIKRHAAVFLLFGLVGSIQFSGQRLSNGMSGNNNIGDVNFESTCSVTMLVRRYLFLVVGARRKEDLFRDRWYCKKQDNKAEIKTLKSVLNFTQNKLLRYHLRARPFLSGLRKPFQMDTISVKSTLNVCLIHTI